MFSFSRDGSRKTRHPDPPRESIPSCYLGHTTVFVYSLSEVTCVDCLCHSIRPGYCLGWSGDQNCPRTLLGMTSPSGSFSNAHISRTKFSIFHKLRPIAMDVMMSGTRSSRPRQACQLFHLRVVHKSSRRTDMSSQPYLSKPIGRLSAVQWISDFSMLLQQSWSFLTPRTVEH